MASLYYNKYKQIFGEPFTLSEYYNSSRIHEKNKINVPY